MINLSSSLGNNGVDEEIENKDDNNSGKRRGSQILSPIDDKKQLTNNISNTINKMFKSQPEAWSQEKVQHFIIYSCMIYNTCRQGRNLLEELMTLGKEDLQQKFKNVLNFQNANNKFLELEERALQYIRAVLVERCGMVFDFSKQNDWTKKFQEILNINLAAYLNNVKKLLPPTVLTYFLQLFVSHLTMKLFRLIITSNALMTIRPQVIPLLDFPQIFFGFYVKTSHE